MRHCFNSDVIDNSDSADLIYVCVFMSVVDEAYSFGINEILQISTICTSEAVATCMRVVFCSVMCLSSIRRAGVCGESEGNDEEDDPALFCRGGGCNNGCCGCGGLFNRSASSGV